MSGGVAVMCAAEFGQILNPTNELTFPVNTARSPLPGGSH